MGSGCTDRAGLLLRNKQESSVSALAEQQTQLLWWRFGMSRRDERIQNLREQRERRNSPHAQATAREQVLIESRNEKRKSVDVHGERGKSAHCVLCSRAIVDLSSFAQLWNGATTYMPFEKQRPLPFFVPNNIEIDTDEAVSLFKAFDEDLSHSLNRSELRYLLQTVGMTDAHSEAALEMMFENSDEVNLEMFSLWLKRSTFIEREVLLKEKIFLTLNEASLSRVGGYVAWTIVMFILISVITYMLESEPSLKSVPVDCHGCEPVLQGATKDLFVNTERLVIGVFTVDYLLRFFTAHATRHFEFVAPSIIEYYLKMDVIYNNDMMAHMKAKGLPDVPDALNISGATKTLRFVLVPLNLVDLFSILPFFLEGLLTGGDGLLVLRILRLCRLFRLFKLKKYSAGFDVFLHTLGQSSAAITVLLFILALLLVFLGTLVFLAEGGAWYKPEDDCAGCLMWR